MAMPVAPGKPDDATVASPQFQTATNDERRGRRQA